MLGECNEFELGTYLYHLTQVNPDSHSVRYVQCIVHILQDSNRAPIIIYSCPSMWYIMYNTQCLNCLIYTRQLHQVVISCTIVHPRMYTLVTDLFLCCFPRGSIQPVQMKNLSNAKSPLVCCYTAEGHTKAVLSVQATDELLFSGSKGK